MYDQVRMLECVVLFAQPLPLPLEATTAGVPVTKTLPSGLAFESGVSNSY